MLTQERYNMIINAVEARNTVTVAELVNIIGTSESTIRRDLNALDEMGKLRRVHGGATVMQEFVTAEADVNTKSQLCIDEKKAIGRYAAATIQDEDFVYIDAGTSTEHMIDYITADKAVYVTNGIAHAKKLIARGMKVYVLGGLVKPSTEAVIGVEGVNNMKKFNFTKAFIGTNGIDIEHGFTTVDVEEAVVKMEAVNRSYISYVLADHTKFDKVSAVTFAPIEKACIVTDKTVKNKYKEATLVKEVLNA
ncbi:MAG: DeoR/GlpR family DNA-binding transcription regulator [Clostridia bacterium]|nr:DeoR/GlpR family DNA-binding transcription regulator [Clostridia bacterium]